MDGNTLSTAPPCSYTLKWNCWETEEAEGLHVSLRWFHNWLKKPTTNKNLHCLHFGLHCTPAASSSQCQSVNGIRTVFVLAYWFPYIFLPVKNKTSFTLQFRVITHHRIPSHTLRCVKRCLPLSSFLCLLLCVGHVSSRFKRWKFRKGMRSFPLDQPERRK